MTSSSNRSSSYFLRKLRKSSKFLQIVRFPGQYVYANGLAASHRRAIPRMRARWLTASLRIVETVGVD